MSMIVLDGINSRSVPLARGYMLQAPGLIGQVRVVEPTNQVMRSANGLSESALTAALQRVDLTVRHLFELDITADRGAGSGFVPQTRSTGEPAITLRAKVISAKMGQAVLYSDESGVLQWIFPDQPVDSDGIRGGAEVTFQLPRARVPVDTTSPETRNRGEGIKLARRIVRVVLWKTDALLHDSAHAMVRAWENNVRHYGWQMVPFDNHDPVDWHRIAGGRTLLLLHGTFSTAEAAFAALPQDTVERLRQHYAGRIIAFNHPSLHHAPAENVASMLRDLRDLPGMLDLDLVTHSRGGLVGRELIRQVHQQGRQVRVHKAVLVAVPNRGTPLVNGDYWIEMLDRYTNLIAQAPDTSWTIALEGLLILVKLIGHATLAALPGLQTMLPNSEYLRDLNTAPPDRVRYHALVADYQPHDAGWLRRFCKRTQGKLVDRFFDEANDGVVPTSGGYSATSDGSGWQIPATQRREFVTNDNISHSTFFANATVNKYLLQWLTTE